MHVCMYVCVCVNTYVVIDYYCAWNALDMREKTRRHLNPLYLLHSPVIPDLSFPSEVISL